MKKLVMAIVDFNAVNTRNLQIRASKRIVPGVQQSLEWEEYRVIVSPETFSKQVLLELMTYNMDNDAMQPVFVFSLRAADEKGNPVNFMRPVTMLIRSTKLADEDTQDLVVSLGVLAFPVHSPGNVWIISSRTADFTEIGFTRILAAKNFSPGNSGTLHAGAFSVVVPAHAFDEPVSLEVYEPEEELDVPPGEKQFDAYALRAVDIDTGELVTKFNTPLLTVLKTNGSKQYAVMPDGSLEYTGLVNGTLVHYMLNTDTAILVTG